MESPDTFTEAGPTLVVQGAVIVQNDFKPQRIDVRSGSLDWTANDGYGCYLVGGVLVSVDGQGLIGRDVSGGRILWRTPVPNVASLHLRADPGACSLDRESVWLDGETSICVTKDGQIRWRASAPYTGFLVYADENRYPHDRFRPNPEYSAGTLPPLPTSEPEKRALAERMAGQLENLDATERARFEKLAPYAFPPLLARYAEWARIEDAMPKGVKSRFTDSVTYYSRLRDMYPLLEATYQERDTGAVVAAWSGMCAKSQWRWELDRLMGMRGVPDVYIPILVRDLRRLPMKERIDSTALSAVAHSSHPRAVALMLEALRDPKAAGRGGGRRSFTWRERAERRACRRCSQPAPNQGRASRGSIG